MKKVLNMVLVAMCILILAGCEKKTNKPTTPPDSNRPATQTK